MKIKLEFQGNLSMYLIKIIIYFKCLIFIVLIMAIGQGAQNFVRRKDHLLQIYVAFISVKFISQNVIKEHIEEIFSEFGTIKEVDVPLDKFDKLCKGFSYIKYSTPEESDKAIKYMDGGKWITFQNF